MKKVLAAGFGAAAAVGVWSAMVEPHWFAVRRFTLPVLPPDHEPIRVLHISDLHLAPWQKHRARWVKALTRLQPDLIVNTGDNLSADIVPEVLDVFDDLLDVPGVFVLGSNDFFSPTKKNPARYLRAPSEVKHRAKPDLDVRGLVAGMHRDGRGWHFLDNTEASLTIRDTRIAFTGLGDAHIDRDKIRTSHGELSYPRFPAEADLRFGITHAPYSRTLEAFSAAGADVVMTGHTHGGQIRIPFWGAPVTNCDLDHTRARGVFAYRKTVVEVSAGLGFSPYSPVRFSCRPEVSLVTLVPRS